MGTYSDDELIAALAVTRGDARSILVEGLRRSTGDRGAAVARRLAHPSSGEVGHVRAAAIRAVADRLGAAATPLFAAALSDRSVEVQLTAADSLARVGDDQAAEALLSWMARKLARPTRAANWDAHELHTVIRYAHRHGSLLGRVAQLILDHRTSLQDEERAWLDEVWPEWTEAAVSHGAVPPPNAAALAEPMLEDHRVRVDLEELWCRWEAESLDPVLRRARRRARL